MLRLVKPPIRPSGHHGVRGIETGGLGTESASQALSLLGGIPATTVGEPRGPIPLTAGQLPSNLVSNLYRSPVTVDGPLSILPGETAEWYLTSFDSFSTYEVVGIGGDASIDRNVITFTAGNAPGDAGFTINGERITFSITGPYVDAPVILNPTIGATSDFSFTAATTAFSSYGNGDTHASTDWEIATDDEFYNIVLSNHGSVTDKLSWLVSGLNDSHTYYLRARHNGSVLGASNWSQVRIVITRQLGVAVPVIVSPIAGSVDLGPSQVCVVNAFVSTEELIQVPRKAATGEILSYIPATESMVHEKTDWVLTKDSPTGTPVVESTGQAGSFSKTFSGLLPNSSYYVKARFTYRQIQPVEATEEGGISYKETTVTGDWCTPVVFETKTTYIPGQPIVITPEHLKMAQPNTFLVELSAFVSPVNDTHASTDWELSTSPDFLSYVFQDLADQIELTKLRLAELMPGTIYYLRARYRSASGAVSDWSDVRVFSTASSFLPVVPSISFYLTDTEYRFKGSNFISLASVPQNSFDFEVYMGPDFNTAELKWQFSMYGLMPLQANGKNTYTVPADIVDGYYWVRICYRDELGNTSNWSTPVLFKEPA